MAIELEDLVDGADYGTLVLNNGTATTPTLVNLTGTCEAGDLAVLTCYPFQNGTTPRTANLWRDSGGTELWAAVPDLGNSSTEPILRRIYQVVTIYVADPAAALWYSWSGAVTEGLDIFVSHNLRGLRLV